MPTIEERALVLVAEIERLWSLLEGRDKFIVQTGLFSDFVDYLRTQEDDE